MFNKRYRNLCTKKYEKDRQSSKVNTRKQSLTKTLSTTLLHKTAISELIQDSKHTHIYSLNAQSQEINANTKANNYNNRHPPDKCNLAQGTKYTRD